MHLSRVGTRQIAVIYRKDGFDITHRMKRECESRRRRFNVDYCRNHAPNDRGFHFTRLFDGRELKMKRTWNLMSGRCLALPHPCPGFAIRANPWMRLA
jgi:hypothetical protein